jgi:hypothetical protein
MGFIIKNTAGLINTRMTDAGRQKLSQGNFNITYFQVGDSEVTYTAIPNYNPTNFYVLSPSFNAQNSSGAPQSNKENVKYPFYVDGNQGNTYGIANMNSVVSPVYNTAAVRGFFTGTEIGTSLVYNWSALTNNSFAINSNYVVQMNTLNGTNTIQLIYNECNSDIVRNIQIGDIITIYYDGNGFDNCLCFSATTTTTTIPPTTTTTTNPCSTPLPATTTTTTTTCPPTNVCCPQLEEPTCVVNTFSCFPILTYKVLNICNDLITVDRTTPDYSYLTSECYARTIVYPSGMTEIYDSVTPINHWSDSVINFESLCYTDQFDVKIWNMNIPWSENPAGLDPTIYKDYTLFGSRNYLGTKEYYGYASDSGQTDSDSVYYFNSFDEKITVLPNQQKAIAIIHYTNNTIDLFYGEKFALEPFDISVNDTTGQARNFKLHIPWLMWHKNPECCFGQTFWVDPPGFEDLNLFEVHYLTSKKNTDMNDPGIRYYHLWDNNPNVNSTPSGIPNRIGKVFPDDQIIVIDDEEIIAALSYKSNRNWTLPSPQISLITPNTCGNDSNSSIGVLTGSNQYMYVTYRLSNSTTFTDYLHCNYYSLIQGPNLSCTNLGSQNVGVRFGSEFGCLGNPETVVTSTTTSLPCPCWYYGFTFWSEYGIDTLLGLEFTPTYQEINGQPSFYSIFLNSIFNIFWNGSNWVLYNTNNQSLLFTFDTSSPIGNFDLSDGEGSITGYTECEIYKQLVVTLETESIQEVIYYPILISGQLSYSDFSSNSISWNNPNWELSIGAIVGQLTGLTINDVPIGTWSNLDPTYTSIVSSYLDDTITITCECNTFTTSCDSCIDGSTMTWVDCYGVIHLEDNVDFTSGINLCTFTLDGNPIWNYISGDIITDGDITPCDTPCTTTTTVYVCTTTTICPVYCDLTQGYYADTFEIICQKVEPNERPNSTEWKVIDFTDQLSAYTVNGFITEQSLTATTFVITDDLYENAPTYNLDYLGLPAAGSTGTSLNFGDEYYFYGNLETDIQATIYEMRYKVNLGATEFLASSNPTWSSGVQPYISEIGLYDSDKNLMIISKLQSPYPRTGIQQFLIKFDF